MDNAATSFPKPDCVLRETARCMREYGGNPGRSSHRLSLTAAKKIYECRCEIAALFNSNNPENVVFTYNTTYALNFAIKMFARKLGGHILMSDIEHNSVYRPVCALSDEGISHSHYNAYRPKGTPDDVIASIKSSIRPDTRILVANHASNICGIVQPIARIGRLCRERGIVFIVDAAQSAGSLDIDMEECNISVLCAPGHKGLLGAQGSGFMIFSDCWSSAESLRGLSFLEGGNGVNSLDTNMPDFLPERFEVGTLGTPAIAGLCEGIKYIKRLGLDYIRARERRVYRRLRELLLCDREITVYADEIGEGSVLLFNVNGVSADEIAARLDRRCCYVRSGYHCSPLAHMLLGTAGGAVRASFGYSNKPDEADRFYRNLRQVIKNSNRAN